MTLKAHAGWVAALVVMLTAGQAVAADLAKDCVEGKTPSIRISGCTGLLERADLTPRQRAIALSFRGNAFREAKNPDRALSDYNEVLGTKAKDLEASIIEGTVAGIILIVNDNQKVRDTPLGAEAWRRVFVWKDLQYNPANLKENPRFTSMS